MKKANVLITSIIRNIEPWAAKFLSAITALNDNSLEVEYLLIEGNSTDSTYSLLSRWVDNCKLNVTLVKHDLQEEMTTINRVMASIELIMDIDAYFVIDPDYIMLIDADIIEMPNNMLTTLIEDMKKYKADIIAPYVLIAGTDRFYDTYVFRTSDKKLFNSTPPYTPNNEAYNAPFEVSSAGTCLLFKTKVFMHVIAENRRYRKLRQKQNVYGYLCVCATAKRMGYRILADPTVRIGHADLTAYGLQWHGFNHWLKP